VSEESSFYTHRHLDWAPFPTNRSISPTHDDLGLHYDAEW